MAELCSAIFWVLCPEQSLHCYTFASPLNLVAILARFTVFTRISAIIALATFIKTNQNPNSERRSFAPPLTIWVLCPNKNGDSYRIVDTNASLAAFHCRCCCNISRNRLISSIGVLRVMWLSFIKPLTLYFCNFLSCTKDCLLSANSCDRKNSFCF